MSKHNIIAALVAGVLLGLVLWWPADAAAQDDCEKLFDQFTDSYVDGSELTFTGTMEDIDQVGSLSTFFVDYGCDEAYVEYESQPGCGEGARVTVVGVVVDVDIFDVVEAHRVICAGN
ncbi:MAG: hypothetical protein Q8P46_17555 [Hyphomicrobiales bacterium]|nr:hypothetical protein [Hyphomicrobiales bacterium]